MAVLECMDVEKIYRQGAHEIRALRGVTFSVNPGEFVCVSGRSGSGKTTLLNCIGTLDSVTRGKIILDGTSVEALRENMLVKIRRRFFGFVFQEARLFPHLSVLDNVALPLVYRGKSWKEARKNARRSLEEVGLAGRADYEARLLSGGEAERAAVARGIVYRPKILLADEPTAELDSATSKQALNLLADQVKQGMTVIAASHDPIVAQIATRTLSLEDGKLQ